MTEQQLLNIINAEADRIKDAIEKYIEEKGPVFTFYGDDWRPHGHLNYRSPRIWGHYIAPRAGGFSVTFYENKMDRGLTGMDACENEGRGVSTSVYFYMPEVSKNVTILKEDGEEIDIAEVDLYYDDLYSDTTIFDEEEILDLEAPTRLETLIEDLAAA